jgi:class 3 adenylate cyclase
VEPPSNSSSPAPAPRVDRCQLFPHPCVQLRPSLFTDIEGSTTLLKQLGRARYGELLAVQQRLLREAFAAHRGEEIDTQGDSFFVAFRSASDAVVASVAIQIAPAAEDVALTRP